MAELPPIQMGVSLSEQAAELMRERILRGEFRLGQRLNEAGIARQLGISRGPVREALKQLRAEGLVREEPRRGAFIVELTAHDVEEIYELRAALETRAARLIFEHKQQDQAAKELKTILDQLKRAIKSKDAAEVARLDLEFHGTLCRLSGNSRLHHTFVAHAAVLRTLLIVEEGEYFSSLTDIGPQHEILVEAMRGNVRQAEAAFNEHLQDAKQRLSAYTRNVQADAVAAD